MYNVHIWCQRFWFSYPKFSPSHSFLPWPRCVVVKMIIVSWLRSAKAWPNENKCKVWLTFIVTTMANHTFMKWLLLSLTYCLPFLRCRRYTVLKVLQVTLQHMMYFVSVVCLLKALVFSFYLQIKHHLFPQAFQETVYEDKSALTRKSLKLLDIRKASTVNSGRS